MNWLTSIENLGFDRASDPGKQRYIKITNRSAIMVFLITLCFKLAIIIRFGWHPDITWPVTAAILFTSVFVLILNKYGWTTLAKVLISVLPVLFAMAFSLLNKVGKEYYPQSDYYAFRYILIGTALLPLMVFSTSQFRLMLVCLAPSFFSLTLYEPIHHLFGVSFRDVGHSDIFYEQITVITVGVYLVLVSVIHSIKTLSRHFEKALADSNAGLRDQNKLLSGYQEQIKIQNEELVAQSELLQHNNMQLAEANLLIDEHRRSLEEQVVEKTRHLSEANSELLLANNELRQFSFTVSHHLRAPTASARGLLQLFRPEMLDEEHREIYGHLLTTVGRMEDVFRDLNHILSLRESLYFVNRRIVVAAEIEQVLDKLCSDAEIRGLEVKWDTTEAPVLYANSQKFSGILFQLLGNAIKFRSAKRSLNIGIKSFHHDGYFQLNIRDNGMGIDLVKHSEKLFQLYQRFHPDREGKGLGLYLVKLQADSLGGGVEIDSREDEFTEVQLSIRKPVDITEQVLLDKPQLRVHFDAEANAVVMVWRGDTDHEQYRDLVEQCAGFLRLYQTPFLISDVSNRTVFRDEDLEWLYSELLAQGSQYNLQRLYVIANQGQSLIADLFSRHAEQITRDFGIRLSLAVSLDEVRAHLLGEQLIETNLAGHFLKP